MPPAFRILRWEIEFPGAKLSRTRFEFGRTSVLSRFFLDFEKLKAAHFCAAFCVADYSMPNVGRTAARRVSL